MFDYEKLRKGSLQSYNYPMNREKTMKNIFFSLIVIVFGISACNLPFAGKTPQVPGDEVSTRVAATMIAVQTAAAIPSATPETLPTVELSTATPEPTATFTLTPTPTESPDDPKLILGDPDFWFNSASSGNPFGVAGNPYEDDAVRISNQVGGLNITSKAVNLGKRWRLTSPTPMNTYLEGTFKVITCAGRDNYGLVLRNPSYNNSFLGYYIGLSCDCSFIADRLDQAGNGYNIVPWRRIHTSNQVKTRSTAWESCW